MRLRIKHDITEYSLTCNNFVIKNNIALRFVALYCPLYYLPVCCIYFHIHSTFEKYLKSVVTSMAVLNIACGQLRLRSSLAVSLLIAVCLLTCA